MVQPSQIYCLFGMAGAIPPIYDSAMTSSPLSEEDRLLVSKFEALQPDPGVDDPACLVFRFTIEETETMALFWQQGLIEPTGVTTAAFTRAGLDKVRRLRAGRLSTAAH
jgi:hypothetical protein